MKKFGLLAFITATLLFTGCSQKTVEMDSAPADSESALNTVETTNNSIRKLSVGTSFFLYTLILYVSEYTYPLYCRN